jgi:hypothetical protein
MLCKGLLLHRGESIHERGSRTISLRDALDRIGDVRHAASMLVLVDRRDSIQHAAAYSNPSSVADYLQTTREFALDLLSRHMGVDIAICPEEPRPTEAEEPKVGELRETVTADVVGQQRDAAWGGGLLAWAEGSRQLRIRTLRGGQLTWLTQEGEFEYMPRTDGQHVAAYRQSGGIVVYEVASGRREVVFDTGAPGDVSNGYLAAQGIGVPGGIGGGIWLMRTDATQVEQLSDGGDSPRLGGGRVVWQEFREDEHLILGRAVEGGDVTILVRGGQQPAVHDALLAWTDVGALPAVRVWNLASGQGQVISRSGIMPDVRLGRVAYLERRGDMYDVRVVSFPGLEEVAAVRNVGFPVGRGPMLTDDSVVWESGAGGSEHRLWSMKLPRAMPPKR